MAIRYTFKVYERLKREQHIDTLFRKGKACSFFPLRFIYTLVPAAETAASPIQAGFSVPKKKFRSSVHRHRVRRMMVEVWRLNKHELYPSVPAGHQLHLFLIFTDNKLPEYAPVNAAIIKGIEKLKELISSTPENNS